jgi:hypothetical protein
MLPGTESQAPAILGRLSPQISIGRAITTRLAAIQGEFSLIHAGAHTVLKSTPVLWELLGRLFRIARCAIHVCAILKNGRGSIARCSAGRPPARPAAGLERLRQLDINAVD